MKIALDELLAAMRAADSPASNDGWYLAHEIIAAWKIGRSRSRELIHQMVRDGKLQAERRTTKNVVGEKCCKIMYRPVATKGKRK
jgi:hypothetical protein